MSEEKALQKKEETALVAATAEDLGFGNLSKDNLMLPFLKLAQNATREKPEGVNPGDFFNTASGENYGKSVVLHVVSSGRKRIKYTKDFKLECKSDDGVHGSCKDATHGNGVCAACPFSKWQDSEEGRRAAYCPPAETFIVVTENEDLPAILSLSKVREKAGRDMRMKLIMIGNQVQRMSQEDQLNHLQVYYKLKLTSVSREVNGYQVYDIKVGNAGLEKNDEKRATLLSTYRGWKDYIAAAEQVVDNSVDNEQTAF